MGGPCPLPACSSRCAKIHRQDRPKRLLKVPKSCEAMPERTGGVKKGCRGLPHTPRPEKELPFTRAPRSRGRDLGLRPALAAMGTQIGHGSLKAPSRWGPWTPVGASKETSLDAVHTCSPRRLLKAPTAERQVMSLTPAAARVPKESALPTYGGRISHAVGLGRRLDRVQATNIHRVTGHGKGEPKTSAMIREGHG